MSRLTGGLFSSPSGTTAGVTFGKARTREGKVTTAREYTVPSNPNSAGQQTQRSKFSSAKDIVRYSTAGWYQEAFNRAVSQLPGFQSMMSIIINALSDAFLMSAPPQTNLGSLDSPQSLGYEAINGSTEITVDFSSVIPLKGNAADEIFAIAIPATSAKRGTLSPAFVSLAAVTRNTAPAVITVPALVTNDVYIIGIFAVGVTTNVGVKSPCTWTSKTVTAV